MGAALSALLCGRAAALTNVWSGSDGEDPTSLTDVNNWAEPPAFDGTDDLAFQLTGATDITSMVSGTVSLNSLVISGSGSASLLISSCSGNLQVASTVTDSASSQVTIAVPISGNASLSVTSGGTLILTAANTYGGGTTVACMSTLQLGDGTNTGSFVNSVTDNGTLVFNNPGSFSFSNGISGVGGVTIQTGAVTLGGSGSNSYSGTTLVQGCASLTDAESNSLSICSAVDLLDHAALNVNYFESIKSLEGDSCTSVNLASGATLLINTGGSMEFGGVIGGCGSLEIGNGATQVLVNTNTYTGGTTIDCSATLQLGDGESSGYISNTSGITDNGVLKFDNTGCTTFSAGISGSGSVEVASGMVTLLGSNCYSNGTTVDCGATLVLGNGEETGTIVGSVTDNGTLAFDNTGCTSFSGGISGLGGVTIENGMVTLGGTNTYSGTTSLNGAHLLDAASNSFSPNSTMSLSGEALLSVNFCESVKSLVGECSSTVCIASDGKLTILQGDSCAAYAGTIAGCGMLEIGCDAYQILTGSNSYSGGTKIGSGATLQLGDGESVGSIAGSVRDNGTLLLDNPGCSILNGGISGSGGLTIEDGMVTLGGSNCYGGTTLVTNCAQLIDAAANSFSPNSAVVLDDSAVLGVNFSETVASLAGQCASSVSISSGGLLVVSQGSSCAEYAGSISGCGALEIGANAYQILTGSNSYLGGTTIDCMATLQLGNDGSNGSIAGGVTDNGTLIFDTTGCTTFSGGIIGNGGVTLENGMVTLGGSNSYSGTTLVTYGAHLVDAGSNSFSANSEMQLTACAALSVNFCESVKSLVGDCSSTVCIGSDGKLVIVEGDSCAAYAGSIAGCGALEIGANAYQILTGSSSFTGTTTIDCLATLQLGDGESNGTIAGNIVDRGSLVFDASGCTTLAGNICGTGSLLINSGMVTLSGNNTYSGGTTLACDTSLTVASDNGIGTGPLTVHSSTVNFTTAYPVINGLTMTGSSAIDFAPGSTSTIIGLVSDTINDSNSFSLGTDSTLTVQVNDLGESDPVFYGTISGSGSLNVTTPNVGIGGELRLAGDNTYTGGTTVGSSALLVASNNSALGTGSVTLYPGSAFGVDHNVSISNQVVIPNDQVMIGGYGTINSAQTITIQNGSILTGGLGLIPAGDGTHSVVGTLSFGSGTTLALAPQGTLQFSIQDAALTFSSVSIAGTLDISALASGGPFTIQVIGVGSDGLTLGFASSFNPSTSYQWTLLSAHTINGTFNPAAFTVDTSLLSNPLNGGTFAVSEVGSNIDLNFTPVPEPSTWALLASGASVVGGAIYRRRKS